MLNSHCSWEVRAVNALVGLVLAPGSVTQWLSWAFHKPASGDCCALTFLHDKCQISFLVRLVSVWSGRFKNYTSDLGKASSVVLHSRWKELSTAVRGSIQSWHQYLWWVVWTIPCVFLVLWWQQGKLQRDFIGLRFNLHSLWDDKNKAGFWQGCKTMAVWVL